MAVPPSSTMAPTSTHFFKCEARLDTHLVFLLSSSHCFPVRLHLVSLQIQGRCENDEFLFETVRMCAWEMCGSVVGIKDVKSFVST